MRLVLIFKTWRDIEQRSKDWTSSGFFSLVTWTVFLVWIWFNIFIDGHMLFGFLALFFDGFFVNATHFILILIIFRFIFIRGFFIFVRTFGLVLLIVLGLLLLFGLLSLIFVPAKNLTCFFCLDGELSFSSSSSSSNVSPFSSGAFLRPRFLKKLLILCPAK